MNLSKTLKTARNVLTANSPVLLVGAAIAGVVTTGVLAAKGGYQARGIIDAAESTLEEGEELDLTDKFRLTWLCFAAPVLTGASTIAATVGVHTIHTKRATAMAGLYAITSGKLDDLQESAEDMLGGKKAQELRDARAQKALDRAGPIENHEILMLGNGDALCYDDWGGRYFEGSKNKIDAAVNSVNLALMEDGEVSLNDFYDYVGLPPVTMGQNMGWSGTKLEVRYGTGRANGAAITPDGRPALAFWFQPEPGEFRNIR